MLKSNLFIAFVVICGLIFTGCGNSNHDTSEQTNDTLEDLSSELPSIEEVAKSVDSIAESIPENLSTTEGEKSLTSLLEDPLKTAFVNSSLAQTLASGEYTIFMPTKEALNEIKDKLSNPAEAEKILKNHIVAQKIGLMDMTPNQELETLGGTKIKLSNKEGVMHVNDVEILEDSDLQITNGYVHKISKILN